MKAQPAREIPQPLSKPVCQAVSPNDEPCDSFATVHCMNCDQWFCDDHAEDDQWHACAIAEDADEGHGG